jgi:hypothetical protein
LVIVRIDSGNEALGLVTAEKPLAAYLRFRDKPTVGLSVDPGIPHFFAVL